MIVVRFVRSPASAQVGFVGTVSEWLTERDRPGRRGRPSRRELYHRLDTQIDELRQRLGGLPSPIEASDIWRGIWFEEAHHSTALEGNTLVLKQVEVLLAEGRAIGAKELREYLEVKGYADAADWVYRQASVQVSGPPIAWSASQSCDKCISWRWARPGTSPRILTRVNERHRAASAGTTSNRSVAG